MYGVRVKGFGYGVSRTWFLGFGVSWFGVLGTGFRCLGFQLRGYGFVVL